MSTQLTGIVIAAGLLGAGCADGGGGSSGSPDGSLGDEDLIDDLEDGDAAIIPHRGRIGGWYTFHDDTPTGTQTPGSQLFIPDPAGAGGSNFAARTTGRGFTEWGAGMGFDLNNPAGAGEEGPRSTYDASGYQVLALQARGNTPVRVALALAGVTPTERGGTCVPSDAAGQECDDLHGTTLLLTSEWKEYQIPFTQLRQGGWGKAVPFDAAQAFAVIFTVNPDVDFDFAVDDVRFYE
jgi:hypothetical protein